MQAPTRRQFVIAYGLATAGDVTGLVESSAAVARAGADPVNGGGWKTGPPMPDERTEVEAATLEGRLYVIGGFVPTGAAEDPAESVTEAVAVYDPDEDDWEYAEPMPEALHHVSIVSTDDRLYVLGGHAGDFEPVDSVYAFDGKAWEARESMPTARGALAAGLLNDRIHVIGGTDGDDALATLEAYDPARDEWDELDSMPTPREHVAAGVVDGRFYAIGGRVAFDDNLSVTESYEPETGEWTEVAGMPTARSGHDAATVNERLYVVGGESPDRTFGETEAYDPATDDWSELEPMPTPRHGAGTAVIDGDVHVTSGGPEPGFSYSDALEILRRG